MKKHKSAFISNREFTEIILPKKKHHYSLPSEVIPEDENADALKETLVGMEYDIESNEETSDYEKEDLFNDDMSDQISEK